MAKNRGCSCWPFSKNKSTTQSQLPRIKNDQIQKSIQRPDLNFNVNFTNNNNPNFLVIQRSQPSSSEVASGVGNRSRTTDNQPRSDSQLLANPLIPNMMPFVNQSNVFEEIRNRNKVRIKTNIQKSQVKYKDDYPMLIDEQKIYKYCCPICLRYFNTILVSSCCQNYLCRLCIGDMAKKAKKDTNFIIRCPHCFENDFKLNDVNQNDKVKFYTDTPFKFTKKEEYGSSLSKNNQSDDKNSKLQNSSQIVSPSFQVHITDISYKKEQRHSDLFSLNPILMNRQESNINPPVGDNEQPVYESPYPRNERLILNSNFNNNENNNIFDDHFAIISPEEERKSQQYNVELDQIQEQQQLENELSQRNSNQRNYRQMQSNPSNRQVFSSLMDQIQNQNINSYRFFKSEKQCHVSIPIHPISQEINRHSLRSINIRENFKRVRIANESMLSHKMSLQVQNKSIVDDDLNLPDINDISNNNINDQIRIKSSQRQVSRSNHSNKSEEVSSTIHKQINVINMFQNDNADFQDSNYGINNSMRESQLNINNKAGHISIKELIAHRNAQSDKKIARRISDHMDQSRSARNSQILQASRLVLQMSPSIKFKDVEDEQDIQVALRLDYKQFPNSEVQSMHQRIIN